MRGGIYIFLFLIMTGCAAEKAPPKHLLQPEEMKEVFWDMLRVQNLSKELESMDTSERRVELDVLNQKVFKVHKIDSATFHESYTWYLKHPDVFKAIVDSLYVQKQRDHRLLLDEQSQISE